MTMRPLISPVALALGALLLSTAPAHGDAAAKRKDRPDNDVRVSLKIRGKRQSQVRVEIKVKNRGRLDQSDLHVVLHDGDPTVPIWTEDLALESGHRMKYRFRLDRDAVGDVLTAECGSPHADDETPDDNEDSDTVTPGTPSTPSAAERGRDLYLPLCSACHGDDGRGGTVDENIARESWDEFVEAFREGEDGMPTFPSLTSNDARDIVAYLRDPDAVGPPAPPPAPVDPPPADTTPTYGTHVKPILDANCIACHGSGFASAGIALHSYAAASQNASATLSSIQAGRMPPSGPLPTADVETIRRWIDGGKLE